ncbi:hypothetical protein M405DRAFT_815031 [Rhizopogon salebrosus TDB-379]|nr:hypothetical protein M405DRAFT_815031 [Rhizopogon salebrosus TDB-379]
MPPPTLTIHDYLLTCVQFKIWVLLSMTRMIIPPAYVPWSSIWKVITSTCEE